MYIHIYIYKYIYTHTSLSHRLALSRCSSSKNYILLHVWGKKKATKVKSYSERYIQVVSTHTHPNFLAPLTSVITGKKEFCLAPALTWLVTVTYTPTTHQICSLIQMLNH